MKNKKIGMLSFHNSLSYGATLQCFALQHVIKKLEYDVEFINYKYSKKNSIKNSENKNSLKSKIKTEIIKTYKGINHIIIKKNSKKVAEQFNKFRKKYMSISNESYNIEDFDNISKFNYNSYITGSDQIWNPYRDDLKIFGLEFVPNNINTISYAASMGMGEIPETKKDYMYKILHKIRHISCREIEGANALKKLLSRNVETVLDPTFLLTKEEWIKYITTNNKLPQKYVLCYFLGTQNYHRKIAMKIAKKNNYKLIIIPNTVKDIFSKGKKIYGCGPQQFLNLFYNASFICTDSFHGTAFAINFNKPFFTFCKRNYNKKESTITRIKDLLELLKLSDRLINTDKNIDNLSTACNFNDSNKILELERKKSISFLKKSLADI